MLKVIVDANVWVSALLGSDNSEQVVKAFECEQFELYYPQPLIDSLLIVTARRKLVRKIQQTALKRLVKLIEVQGSLVQPQNIFAISRDPDDDIYLACAEATHCDYLVTGDKDLLVLKNHRRTRIVTPAQFLKALKMR